MRSAPSGTGIIAGGPVRAVCEVIGIQDIVAKSIGSANPHNVVKASVNALLSQSSPKLLSITTSLTLCFFAISASVLKVLSV